MRLHRLELTAFGPFAGTQSVDFDELSAAGLFLLHGPTGSGKTSVLDGVCFALYGQVPGARPATRLRSDHAAAGTSTEVVLELTVGGRRLEITRRPEQPRAKKRGSGTTLDKAVTLLREFTGGEWRALSKSHQEIGEEIKQLVGMSCEQFCQVVLLPQGEFATFLRASATERTELLGRLFDTRRFKAVERWLRDRRQDADARLGQGDQDLASLAERMGEASVAAPALGAWLPEGVVPGHPDYAGSLLEWAAVLRSTAREQHAIASCAVRHAEAADTAAAAAAGAERDLHALQSRHALARRRAADLALAAPTRTAERTRLESAHRAATVEPALALWDKAAAQHRDAAAAEQAARQALSRADTASAPGGPAGQNGTAAVGSWAGRGGAGRADSPEGQSGPGAGSRTEHSDAGDGPTALDGRGVDGSWAVRSGPGAAGSPERQNGPGVAGSWPACGTREAGGSAGQNGRGADGSWAGRGGAGGSEAGRGSTAVPGSRAPRGDREQVGGLDAGALTREEHRLREELGGLAGAAELELRVRELGARRGGLDREERGDEEAVREADGWLEEWPGVRDELRGRLDAAQEAAERAAGLAASLERAAQRLAAAAERDTLTAQSERAEDARRDARDRAAGAREAWQDLREARIAGIAAELAGELEDGEPCRVCGSPEHPAPALPSQRQVTRADEDAAYDGYQRESTALEAASGEALRLSAALEAARATAGDAPQHLLAAAHAAVAAEHAQTARRAADVPELRRESARAEEERDRRTEQRADALHRTAARTSRREELDQQHAQLSAELTRARGGYGSVAVRRDRLAARIALLDRAVHAVRDGAESAARLAEAHKELAQAAARAGFASADEATAALLSPAELRQCEQRVQEWAREEAAVEADLAAPEPAAAAALPPADPAAAQAAAEAANRRLRTVSATESHAGARCVRLDELGAQATAQARELAPARAAFARIKRLSDLASANSAENRFKMELETYVLAARLEQVAAAAAVRLQRMSAGRYTLVHTDARSGGRAKSGLGLMVVDAWTGTERDTATLSGGETFFASLALALGLADVVTDEAGGTRLDTLFIDEGFGSLDDQTLDEVLDVLDGLRERDRAVGIVSHVADLRHRIPAQLRVVKGRDGSSVRLRTAAAVTG